MTIHIEDFINHIRFDGILAEPGGKIRIGFTYKDHSYVQITNFQFVDEAHIQFLHEAVLHLNPDKENIICPFCEKKSAHLSGCLELRESELQNWIVEQAMMKVEQDSKG